MDFDNFLQFTPKILNVGLPATIAHAKMTPSNRMDLLKKLNPNNVNPKKAAVMMLFYPKNNQTHLVLILRNSYKGVHSSQIAFPGGKPELIDVDLKETALRETHEEIGILPNKIEVIRSFTEVYIPPSNYMVQPYLGISREELNFVRQEEEVAGIIELPLVDFLDERIIQNKKMNTSYASNFEVPGFLVKEHFVWGATAMMLSELKETLKIVL
ncbi:MAG: CoA pyrophosphatase [Flavobacterium sp.]|uniref:NUDIX hydrolase n=1 Tax=Flavobacterium sp. TaxID=239 RepID=UPI003528DDF5